MKLKLVSIEKDGVIRVASEGNITSLDFDAEGTNPLQQIIGQTWSSNRVVLDLSQSGYVDSSAVGWLIGTARAFRAAGGAIAIHSLQPTVKQILDLLKVQRVVQTADNEAAARLLVMDQAAGKGAPA